MVSRRRSILTASFCALVAVVVVAHAASGAAPAPRWIVLSAHPNDKPGPIQLIRIQTNGAGVQQITRGSKSAVQPSFSPDGKRIAFARLGSGIFSMNLNGTGLRRVTSGTRDIFPVWSPDGKRIAFTRPYRAEWRLYVTSPTGAGLRRLPLAPPAGRPSWTPDGKSILIPSAADIVQVDSQTGRIQKYYGLTLDIQTTQTAAVSPDGKTVVYLGPRFSTGPEDCGEGPCPQFALFIARVPAPHRPRRIVNDTGAAGWSPDGKTLAYVHLEALTLRTVATGKTRTIDTKPHLAAGDSPPAWQPS